MRIMYALALDCVTVMVQHRGCMSSVDTFRMAQEFDTLSGKLIVTRKKNLYEMDFPTYEQEEISVTDDMERAFGVRPVKAILGPDLVCIFESEDQASKRGGNLYCELLNNGRISISGEATLVAISDIVVSEKSK